MTTPAIRLQQLRKTFGRGPGAVEALRGIDLEIEPGQVYGFLGPNGAGKTTTIRLIMGLIRPNHGSAQIFGQEVGAHPEVLSRVGALVEDAVFYNHLTARDNLRVLSLTAGLTESDRIEQLLHQLDLHAAAGRRVHGFSTGMKQRLGIAAALLGDPELVILDEPTNGLDPAGIIEIRRFIRSLSEQHGKSVFLSSHLLHEVEQVCDRVAIIQRGQVLREGPVGELLDDPTAELRIQVDPTQAAMRQLQPRWRPRVENDWIYLKAGPDDSPEVVAKLVKVGIRVRQVIYRQQSLEDFFISVTAEEPDQVREPGNVDPSSSSATGNQI